MIEFILLIAAAYLIGSIPTGVIVGRMQGFDPRGVGSGNIGMTNVARAGGSKAAAITFIGDILKGAIPVAIARAFGFTPSIVAAVAIAAFIGSICSVFLGFSGGKGVSAALGIWLVISPIVLLIALAVFIAVFAVSRIMSLASICAAIALPPAALATGLPRHYVLLAIIMSALVLFRHLENIQRLRLGEEPKFSTKRSEKASA
ncbi:MAG TPA: glycerol-3-phosphate 1-O-acyltransferase PlsY [Candidatus Binataceae bacterium]|nr:glycerol-3-phosphate 1-O-acyltransferase PlsY [Candidatus Binataceae bacterium]